MSNIRPEFTVHLLNEEGLKKAGDCAAIFSEALNKLEALGVTKSREAALVITKMQEASFFAKRHIALAPENTMPGA